MVVPNNYQKKANLQLLSRKAAAVLDNVCSEEKKKVWKKRILFVLMFVFVFGYMQRAIFYEKKKERGIERGGYKDGFINFKYY